MALADNLVFYSSMEDLTSTTVEENTGTYTITKTTSGDPAEVVGKVGNCQSFNQTDYLNTSFNPRTAIGTGDFSVSVWFKMPQVNTRRNIFYFGASGAFINAWALYGENAANSYSFKVSVRDGSAGNYQSPNTVTGYQDDNWHHCIIDRSGTTFHMYLDNSLIVTATNVELGVNLGAYANFGSDQLGSVKYEGEIDEMGIWTKVLNSTERSELWNGGDGISYADIVGGGPSVRTGSLRKFSRL